MGKKLLLSLILALSVILIFYFFQQSTNDQSANNQPTQDNNSSQNTSLVTVKPDLTQNKVIAPTQPIEITFQTPIENIGEFKHEITPSLEYELKLSDDKKIVTISPKGTYPVGKEFTIKVQSDTKIEGKKTLGQDVFLHFRTIDYKGV